MKKQYFLLILVWLLFAVSGCKDDYRSVVLFEGAEPVYQVGTCDNLVSSLAFFLSETEGETVLGIDGGDGAYTLTNEHESVAAVTFAGDSNGYRRISIQPLAAGETVVRVMDGSGSGAQLRITVKERREYKMSKQGFEYGISGDAPVELLGKVSEELSGRSWLEDSGYYVLIPDKGSSYYLIRECWKSILRGRKMHLLREVTRQFRWQGKTGTYMRCGGLLMTESRESLREALPEVKEWLR